LEAKLSQLEQRNGDWMQTYTGRQFWPLDPRPNEIFIEDIAHHLSLLCRYGGAVKRFYSVAEHCVHMARWLPQSCKLWGLMHDAAEAYLVDVPRPAKEGLAGYKAIEDRIMWAVCERFHLPFKMDGRVKAADNRIITDERTQNMVVPVVPWELNEPALGITIECWSPAEAEEEFLEAFWTLATPEWLQGWRRDRGEGTAP
jgi:hypothetical protein